jgi:hypothetical protein
MACRAAAASGSARSAELKTGNGKRTWPLQRKLAGLKNRNQKPMFRPLQRKLQTKLHCDYYALIIEIEGWHSGCCF